MGRERLRKKLEELRAKGEKALVSYMMVGYPDFETSMSVFRALLENGTDILEIGFPFSDPVADGPTIQVAHDTALKKGVKARDVFNLSLILREEFSHIPFLLMTYYNPIFRMGLDEFCKRAKESGIDGFIVPDLPPEEALPLKEATQRHGLSLVFLASPTSTPKRLSLICESGDDMVYFVSVTGTTGAREHLPLERLERDLGRYRELCDKPVVVGFGVSTPEQARAVARLSDGVVVGSALVKLAGERRLQELSEMVRSIKASLR